MSDTMEWRAHLPVDASCFGEGDTYLVHNVLPSDIISDVFQRLSGEVKWASMSHRGTFMIICFYIKERNRFITYTYVCMYMYILI